MSSLTRSAVADMLNAINATMPVHATPDVRAFAAALRSHVVSSYRAAEIARAESRIADKVRDLLSRADMAEFDGAACTFADDCRCVACDASDFVLL